VNIDLNDDLQVMRAIASMSAHSSVGRAAHTPHHGNAC